MYPYLTDDLAGIGGTLKTEPEDFLVEEIPAYEPAGEGEHLFVWIEKRNVSAEGLTRHLARNLDVDSRTIGVAGLKYRVAITRQYVSLPAECESRLAAIETDEIRVLHSGRHTNKLRTGHLRGNSFRILLRDVDSNAAASAKRIHERLVAVGFPNYFGDQRMGRDGETLDLGLALLRGERSSRSIPPSRRRFLERLSLSAVQSWLFNQVLAERIRDGLASTVLEGDVLQVTASGGPFVAEDVPVEQRRLDAGEVVVSGPLFGPKMRQPRGVSAEREQRVLEQASLTADHFLRHRKLTPGGRRPLMIRVEGLQIQPEPDGLRFEFTLPSGVYATTLLREFIKPAKFELEVDERPAVDYSE